LAAVAISVEIDLQDDDDADGGAPVRIPVPISDPDPYTLSQYPDERRPATGIVCLCLAALLPSLSRLPKWLIEFEIYALSAAGGFVILSFLAWPIRISFVCLAFYSEALIPLEMVE